MRPRRSCGPRILRGVVKIEGMESTNARQNAAQQAAAGKPAPIEPSIRINFYPEGGFGYSNDVVPNKDGSFVWHNISPSTYRLWASGVADGGYVRAVRVGDQEFDPDNVDLSGGVGGELRLIIEMGAAQVDGTVRDRDGQVAASVVVTLIPDPQQPEHRSLYHQTSTDQKGQFSLKNAIPGKYRLYAWEELEQGAQEDLEFMKPFRSRGVAIDLSENGREQVSGTMISASKVEAAKAKTGH